MTIRYMGRDLSYKKRIGRIGCEGCGRHIGFRTRHWWVEFPFLHGEDPE